MRMRVEQPEARRLRLILRPRAYASSRVRAGVLAGEGATRGGRAATSTRVADDTRTAAPDRPGVKSANRVAAALLTVAILYRVVLTLRGWPMVQSDEAVIGLMARHILHGERPIWFWGQQYMGALQAYVAALVFKIFGSSSLSLRLAILPFTAGFLVCAYVLGRAAYGHAVGLLTLAWLVAGPAIALQREQTAIGGYQDMLLFGAVILVGVWLRLRQPHSLPRTRGEWVRALVVYAGIGLAGGAGLWSDLLILPVLFMAGYTLIAVRTREMFSVCGLVLILSFFAGGYPYISYNITNQNATYKELVRESHPGGSTALLPHRIDWTQQIGETLAVALPVTLGSPHVCINKGSIWAAYPPGLAEVNHTPQGACDNGNILLSFAAIFIYVLVAWQIGVAFLRYLPGAVDRIKRRTRRTVRTLQLVGRYRSSDTSGERAPEHPPANLAATLSTDETARLWLRLMMLGIAAMTLALYTTNQGAQIYQFTSSRYLFLLYLTSPLLVGCLWTVAEPVARPASLAAWRLVARATQRVRTEMSHYSPAVSHAPSDSARAGGRLWAMLASLALLALLAASVYGGIRTAAFAFNDPQFGLPEPHLDGEVISFLDAHHITAYYSDYWTCYRILFETNERITCAVRGQNGAVGLDLMNNRNDLYIHKLALVQNPAYILPRGTAEDRAFVAETRAQHLPSAGYVRAVLGSYAIYYHP